MGFIVQNFNPGLDTGISSVLTGLPDQSFATSPSIYDNLDYISANIQLTLTMNGDGSNTMGAIVCYISRSIDDVTFDDNGFEPSAFNLAPLGSFTVDSTTTNTYIFSMDTDIAGSLPPYWIFVVFNNSSGSVASGTGFYCPKEYFAF